jgi:SAM-dependent methyltransferase
MFEKRLTRYIGCDFPGNEQAGCLIEDTDRIPLEDSIADFVLSTQVLEHVADPEQYLAESRRVLKNGGLLILSTHGVWRYHPDPCDYWRWTSEGLKKILTEAEFEVVRFRGIMGPAATALQLWQDAILTRLHWRLATPFSSVMQRIIQFADSRCPNEVRDRDACVFITVSRKTE